MKYCSHCGTQLQDEAAFCSQCGHSVTTHSATPDNPSIGLNIVAFLLPIVGLILYLVNHEKSPNKAKSIGKWALISFALNCVLLALM